MLVFYFLIFIFMFKWRIVSRSNINGKVHSFQKDFDDYDSYQEFVSSNPEYAPQVFLDNFWNPFGLLNQIQSAYPDNSYSLPTNTKYLPEGIDLSKYENRRLEKRQSEAEKLQKKYSLERSKAYLDDYIAENPDDADAKADIDKIEKEIKTLS